MSQIGKPFWNKKVEDRIYEVFYKALADIKTEKEAKEFVLDFFTPIERINLAKRLGIFILLKNEWEYRDIRQVLHVSSGTIAKIQGKLITFGMRGISKFVRKIIKEDKPHTSIGGSSPLGGGKRLLPKSHKKYPYIKLPY